MSSNEKGKENYQQSKNRKRERPNLNRTQLRSFLELCARASGSGDFEIRLGLGRQDVDWLKGRLNINDPEDAKKYLAEFGKDADLEEMMKGNEREFARRKRQEAQARFEANEALRIEEDKKRRAKIKAMIDPLEIKNEHQERQRRFDERKNVDGNKRAIEVYHTPSKYYEPSQPLTCEDNPSWQLPDTITQDQFKVWITHYGLRFVRDHFNISNADIRRESERLNLKIDWDLVRR